MVIKEHSGYLEECTSYYTTNMQPETPQRRNQEPFRTPNQAASQIPVISSSGRRRPRSNAEIECHLRCDRSGRVGCSTRIEHPRGIIHEGSTQGT
jgi:hypothetical protein